ncbi:MAG: sigma-70 family RNA polymerase sigma factor [Erysipelotrichaceae bacterium]|nr:sigma-70 family RNA polymerase sigma factor [Erysipelotrichaceae bacterium]
MKKEEKILCAAIGSHNEAKIKPAYGQIYLSYRGLLHFVSANYALTKEEREDAVEETFLSFFAYPKKTEIVSIRAFLLKTLENKCADALRKRLPSSLEEEVPSFDPMRGFVEELKALLSEEEFALLMDYVVYERSSAELAQKYALSGVAVRQRIARIKKKVRHKLEVK